MALLLIVAAPPPESLCKESSSYQELECIDDIADDDLAKKPGSGVPSPTTRAGVGGTAPVAKPARADVPTEQSPTSRVRDPAPVRLEALPWGAQHRVSPAALA